MKKDRWGRIDEDTRQKIEMLGKYNSEVRRGIMHTEEWEAQMEELQAWFDHFREELAGIG